VDNQFIDSTVSLFKDKDSEINPYFEKFKTNEFDLLL
jgi:hypothetical protein